MIASLCWICVTNSDNSLLYCIIFTSKVDIVPSSLLITKFNSSYNFWLHKVWRLLAFYMSPFILLSSFFISSCFLNSSSSVFLFSYNSNLILLSRSYIYFPYSCDRFWSARTVLSVTSFFLLFSWIILLKELIYIFACLHFSCSCLSRSWTPFNC